MVAGAALQLKLLAMAMISTINWPEFLPNISFFRVTIKSGIMEDESQKLHFRLFV